MKLFLSRCHYCSNKVPVDIAAENRPQIRYMYGQQFYIKCPVCYNVSTYTPGEIVAQTDSNSKVGGGVIGGLVGLLGGPLGLIIGAGIGTAIGNANDSEDEAKVRRFNHSH